MLNLISMKKDKIRIGWVEYQVYHNLESLGYDIDLAFKGFLTKRRTLTLNNFCSYIKNADPRFICVPC